jgi:hypothetical protein
MKKPNALYIAGLAFLLLCAAAPSVPAADGAVTRRYGLFIGSNNGGRDRVTLRYAVNDARTVSRIFGSMGGISAVDNILLVEPAAANINRRLDALGKEIEAVRKGGRRTELVFYYSGHSDENGILLDRERYGYRELRERIGRLRADMKIIILDSCASGAITRAKGGTKTQPFLFDSSVSTEGYAFLTSSSASEVSQESDRIGSSYFTHSLVAGLRGAADSVGDGRVTLNELYRFAYTETLAKTETSMYGAQHPSYDIQVSGSGDVVLTDVKETSAGLVIAGDVTGRISIRDASDFLAAELTKLNQKPMEFGLESGLYRITLQKGDTFYRAEITLEDNNRTLLSMADFSVIAASSGSRRRGDGDDMTDTEDAPEEEDVPEYRINLQFIPGLDINGHSGEKATNNVLLGLFAAVGHNIKGIGIAPQGLVNRGYIHGLQVSGLFNYAGGNVEGVQTAGLFNYTGGEIRGVQAATLFNYASENVEGVQAAGLFNYAGKTVEGVQTAALFNYAGLQAKGVQAAGLFNYAGGEISGLQAGLFNYAGGAAGDIQASSLFDLDSEIRGLVQLGLVNISEQGMGVQVGLVNISGGETVIPLGLVNIIENGILHPSVYLDDMMFLNLGFRSGSKYFYTLFGVGVNGWTAREQASGENKLFVGRIGFGSEFSLGKSFINIDAVWGQIIGFSANPETVITFQDSPDTSIAQLRLSAGYKLYEHLGIFCGVSYDIIHRWNDSSPDPLEAAPIAFAAGSGKTRHKLGFFGGIQF